MNKDYGGLGRKVTQETEPGSSFGRLLLALQLTAKMKLGRGQVCTRQSIPFLSLASASPVWRDHRSDLATSLLGNFYPFLTSEQNLRDTCTVPYSCHLFLHPCLLQGHPQPQSLLLLKPSAPVCWSLCFEPVSLLLSCSLL